MKLLLFSIEEIIMSDEKVKKTQDVITYDQKLFLTLEKKESVDLLYDPNYRLLVDCIRFKPLTVDEIMKKYAIEDNPKSLMTVYRYIRKLTKLGLIVESGKRIFTYDNNRNKTVTLYSTVARLFYFTDLEKISKDATKIREKECKVYNLLLKNLTNSEAKDLNCISKLLGTIYDFGLENMSEIMNIYEQDLPKYLSDFSTMMINTLVVHIGWMSAILNEDMREKILKCLE